MWVIINLMNNVEDIDVKVRSTIPKKCRPSVLYRDEEVVESDLLKLTEKFPGQFVLFEAKAAVKTLADGQAVQVVPVSEVDLGL